MAIELTTATTQQLSGIRQSLGFNTYTELFPGANTLFYLDTNSSNLQRVADSTAGVVDFKSFGKFQRFGNILTTTGISTILNANVLTNLKDDGTALALIIFYNNLTEAALNQLFTDLPATNNTATIDVRFNPGAATCNTSIATNKGYTVVTS